MEFNFDDLLPLDQNFTGDTRSWNPFQNNSLIPFYNDAGNRSQIGYAGPPAETRMVSFAISLTFCDMQPFFCFFQYQQNAVAQPVPMQNTLSTASHADLLGAQNQAHTKLYEGYIGLKHDISTKM